MKVTINLTRTGAEAVAEALERSAELAADGWPTPAGQFLIDIAHQIRLQADLPQSDVIRVIQRQS